MKEKIVAPPKPEVKLNRYWAIIEFIFLPKYRQAPKALQIDFTRNELVEAATALKIALPKNLGDIIYAIKFRSGMPPSIVATERDGLKWIIDGTGRATYRFRLARIAEIEPNTKLQKTKIPDSTPELISLYELDDEQALLAKIRYNRLVDTFLGITTYSLQNHLRTTVKGIGQIEIDELYVGVDKRGCHYLIPVQAKGGTDKINVVQCRQDYMWCQQAWPGIRCRPLAAHFIDTKTIAMFELGLDGEEMELVEERHYRLVPGDDINLAEKTRYKP